MTDDNSSNSRGWTRRSKVLLTLAVALAVYVSFIGVRMYVMQPRLNVSRETTFITEPLRPDGTVDYAAALHEEWSKGVTPENNAAVPLARAFGPAIIAPEIRVHYFELIGIEPLPANGHYFVTLDDYLRKIGTKGDRQGELRDVYSRVSREDVRESYPELEAWVQANEEPLKLIEAASRFPRFYSPLLTGSPNASLDVRQFATHLQCREVARVLRLRAMLYLESNDTEAACDDAILLHRVGRLIADSPSLIGHLIGTAFDAVGAEVTGEVVLSGGLSPERASTFRRQVETLPPFPDSVRVIDLGERFVSLDSLHKLVVQADQEEMRYLLPRFDAPVPKLDPNIVLGETNETYDVWVDALNDRDPSRRRKRLKDLNESLTAQVRRTPGFTQTFATLLTGDRADLTRQLSATLLAATIHAIEQAQDYQDTALERTRLVRLGAVIGQFRAINDGFPNQIGDLRGDLLQSLPMRDLWGRQLKYVRLDNGFLLYSFGPNGQDDGGLQRWECEEPDDCDDVRVGLKPLPANDNVELENSGDSDKQPTAKLGRHSRPYNCRSATSIAFSNPFALLSVSSYSLSGTLSATRPAPA